MSIHDQEDGKVVKLRNDIDGLRGLAILEVVLFHAWPSVFPFGFTGVDIFFVISGFLISGSLVSLLPVVDNFETHSYSWFFWSFWNHRIRRLIPSQIVVSVFVGTLSVCFLLPKEHAQVQKTLLSSSLMAANFEIMTSPRGYWDPDTNTNPMLHFWSLSVEEQFYLIWPLITWSVFRWFRFKFSKIMAISSLAFMFFSFLLFLNMSPTNAYFSPFSRIWAILSGCALRFSQGFVPHFSVSHTVLFITGCLCLLSSVLFCREHNYFSYTALFPVLGTLLLISSNNSKDGGFFEFKAIVFLGRVSYSLYLFHWPVIVFVRHFVPDFSSLQPIGINLMMISAISISFLMAAINFIFIENPIRHHFPSKWAFSFYITNCLIAFSYFNMPSTLLSESILVPMPATKSFSMPNLNSTVNLPTARNIIDAINHNWNYPHGMGSEGTDWVRTGELIIFNPGREQKILILGDSHSQQLWKYFSDLRITLLGKMPTIIFYTSCLPLDMFGGWCDQRLRSRDFAKIILPTLNVSKVVFSLFFENYINSNLGWRDNDWPDQQIIYDLKSAWNTTVFFKLAKLVLDLSKQNVKSFLVWPYPSGQVFDPKGMINRMSGSIHVPHPVSLKLYFESPKLQVITHFLKLLQMHTNLRVLDPSQYWCFSGICPTIDPEGLPVMKDDNHFRPNWFKHYGKFLDPLVFSDDLNKC